MCILETCYVIALRIVCMSIMRWQLTNVDLSSCRGGILEIPKITFFATGLITASFVEKETQIRYKFSYWILINWRRG